MSDSPLSRKQPKICTPRRLALSSPDKKYSMSQPFPVGSSSLSKENISSSLRPPSLQPPLESCSINNNKFYYSQSPPRSPNRSPTRKLELIQLSPVKINRIELRKLYNSQQNYTKRLCIHKLVLNNFKSYAGEQVVGPFHSSFSAVVGPNGSGKSNVIDSMLFVFGFRANKMRQGRLSELIHKSENYPNLDSCSVDVHFQYVIDEVDGTTKTLDEEGLIVGRKAFRNNNSKYYINGQESSYTEVTKLLRSEGIDLDHKRFLILQGEVESIAQMKPKAECDGDDGLLEYLEDIIGTTKYKPLIETSLAEIDQLNETCLEKEKRFKLVESEKLSLESDKDNALEFLSKEKELTLAKSKILQYNIFHDQKKIKTMLEKSSKLSTQLTEEREKHTQIKKDINILIETCEKFKLKSNEFDDKKKELINEKHKLDCNRASIEEKKKNLTEKCSKAEKIVLNIENDIVQSSNKLQELTRDQESCDNDLKTLNEKLSTERSKLEEIKLSLRDKTSEISKEISVLEKDLEPWNTDLNEKKSQIKLIETQISIIKTSQDKLDLELGEAKSKLTSLDEKLKRKQELILKLQTEARTIDEQALKDENEYNIKRAKLNEMKSVLSSHRQRAIDARSVLSNVENKNKVLAALQKLAKSGCIHGFYGRLGDLGTIDDKYDVAISTACPRLEDIVVENVECGQKCIEYLRKNQLGYARFILLDKLRNFNLNPINTPEGTPRLFDLIKPHDKKFAPAFYSIVRDTLVANDLKQANRVAYGRRRFRVVTLEGNLIDISGTMSGGGNRKIRGLMKSKSLENSFTLDEVQKIERELAEKERIFKSAMEKFHDMENTLNKLRDRKPEINLEISKHEMELEALSVEINLERDRLVEINFGKEEAKKYDQEITSALSNLENLNKEYKELENKSMNKRQKIDELKDKIMEIGGIDLKVQNSKVDSTHTKIQEILLKQKLLKSNLKKTVNEIKRLKNKNQESTDIINACRAELSNIEISMKDIQVSTTNIEELIRSNDLDKQKILNDYSQSKDMIDEKSEIISHLKSKKLEINSQVEKLNDQTEHINRQINFYQNELGKLFIRDTTELLKSLENDNNFENSVKIEYSSEITGSNTNETDVMDIDEEYNNTHTSIPCLSEIELENIEIEKVREELDQLEDYMNNTKANIDVLDEYARRLAEYRKRKLDLDQTVSKRDNVRVNCETLKKKRHDEFMEGFGIISMTLKEMYQMITVGGNAELELVDSLDPFSEGVLFSVMPPKKGWKNISNLSGGEKTLSSLALVFALHRYKPTPLYVMDEIDAALDFRNVSIVANYIKERTKNAQFIVISLRNNMFELAQQLIGIYKNNNMTRSTTLKNLDTLSPS